MTQHEKEPNYTELQSKAWDVFKNVKVGDRYIDTRGNTHTAYKNAVLNESGGAFAHIDCGPGFLWEAHQDNKFDVYGKVLTNSSEEKIQTSIPESKFNVGDIIDTDETGYQYTSMDEYSKRSNFNWGVIKGCNCKTSITKKDKVLDKVYSPYTNSWWYKTQHYINWISEDCMSLSNEPTINTYGLQVGDKLPKKVINNWPLQGENYYHHVNPGKWGKERGSFLGDREIQGFKVIDGVVGFLVSDTQQVYLRAEGFKEFMESFNKPKFEVGKWYTHPKWAPNSFIKFSSIRDYNSVFELERISQGSYTRVNTNWSISYEHTLEEADMNIVSNFLPNDHPDKISMEKNMFSAGDYIVMLAKSCINHSNNWCYKLRKDSEDLDSCRDNKGSTSNGTTAVKFRDKKTWRYATPEEITEYERICKPYDVSTLKKSEPKPEEWIPKIGDWVVIIDPHKKINWVSGMNKYVGKVVQLIDKPDNYFRIEEDNSYWYWEYSDKVKHFRKAEPHEIPKTESLEVKTTPTPFKYEIGDNLQVTKDKSKDFQRTGYYNSALLQLQQIEDVRNDKGTVNARLQHNGSNYYNLSCWMYDSSYVREDLLDKIDEIKSEDINWKVGDWVYAEKQNRDDYRKDKYIPIFRVEEVCHQVDVVYLRPVKDIATGIKSKYCRKATPEEIADYLRVHYNSGTDPYEKGVAALNSAIAKNKNHLEPSKESLDTIKVSLKQPKTIIKF